MLRIFVIFFLLIFSFESQAKTLAKIVKKTPDAAETDAQSSLVSTDEVIKQIEKSLLFNKDEREQMEVYSNKDGGKKSTDFVDATNDSTNTNPDLEIVVVNPKANNMALREKEKLAYNASLISQYEVSVELYKQILKEEPKNYYAKFSLAVAYQKLGQLKQAKNIYYELLQSNSGNPEEVVENLLSVLVEESPKEAAYMLSRLSMQNPSSPTILAQAAIAYEKIKDYDKAIGLLTNAVVLDPKRADYKYNLAVIYDKASKYEEALALYNEVVKDYSTEYRSALLDEVRNRIEVLKNRA